ncbi:MAG: signal peptidase I [Clostridiales bacterium]|nr:signal peptidase I [Clostridiales bacterium]
MKDEKYNQENEITAEAAEITEAAEGSGDEKGKKDIKKTVFKEIISWAKTILAALIFAYLITTFIIVNAQVPSGSMKDTINEGDRLVANRLSYLFSDPQRFDIVVFKFPDNEDLYYIKRIIGLPGETVEIKDGKVYIDGSEEPLDDSFIKEPMYVEADAVYEVPEDSYFMLGDNRNNSADSRKWVNKYVKRNKILGKAIFKYYPGFELLTDK